MAVNQFQETYSQYWGHPKGTVALFDNNNSVYVTLSRGRQSLEFSTKVNNRGDQTKLHSLVLTRLDHTATLTYMYRYDVIHM